ncbi:MAG: STAS domain-containing protein [Desulfobacterales bacterium]|jgi:anti-sigma B factor antagonist|nr:MAG: STAS domain-containing protein [Desulfobacterales bacterium]
MSLKVTSTQTRPGIITISPIGSVDTRTYTILEEKVDSVLKEKPNVIIFDMEFLDYINSMGVRVLLKSRKHMKKCDGKVVFMKLQPQIKKVFDVLKALPSMRVFASIKELDNYLDAMQKAAR